jgi:hypothetical protein
MSLSWAYSLRPYTVFSAAMPIGGMKRRQSRAGKALSVINPGTVRANILSVTL